MLHKRVGWMGVFLLITTCVTIPVVSMVLGEPLPGAIGNTIEPTEIPTLIPQPTPTLPNPATVTYSVPDPVAVTQNFLNAWKADDYSGMYTLLTEESKTKINEEDFTRRYLDLVTTVAVREGEIDYEVLSFYKTSIEAGVTYQIVLHSAIVGDIEHDVYMRLVLEEGAWRIVWGDALIWPDLTGGNVFSLVNYAPTRGLIFDRYGEPLVEYTDAYAVGLVPALIDRDNEDKMLGLLARATGFPGDYIFSLYANYGYDSEFYVPIADAKASVLNPYYNSLISYDAILVNLFHERYYLNGGLAPQLIGYMNSIQPDEVDYYRRQGYQWIERVPRAGIELWGETYLSGQRGGTLFIDGPDGNVVSMLGEARGDAKGSDIITTLDKDLQIEAQRAMFGTNGAVVVLERDTGRVLALVSSPGFNPNLFAPWNYNGVFASPFFNENDPMFNRATQGQYPLGSVFKIVTISAALESQVFTAESVYDCQHAFTELVNPILYDWTYWDELPPSGELTLPEGLMRSCNPWFYKIGLELFNQGMETAIADMARGFGLGRPTSIFGIEEKEEAAGQVPASYTSLEATNLAIGQGDLLVTPLQVAAFVAAVGNGGTLYRPNVIERIESPAGEILYEFGPEAAGELPVSPETLATVQDAMRMVIQNPRGTAYRVLGGSRYELVGKTGTAQTSGGMDPHAWFVVYTDEGRADRPDIAVVVLVENVGEGADYAAPVARRVIYSYFKGW